MSITPQTPGVADHAAPDPAAQAVPEPLVKAETVRTVLLALVAAGAFGGTQIPDLALSIIVPILTVLVGAGVSWGLTLITRGKVWAIRHGVDVDQVVDELQRRTGGVR